MLRGLTTVRFHASDLPAAKRWYTELLGVEPYFERPGYAEFRIREFGEGFVGASVLDPFGNVLGLTRNQHYLDDLATRPGEAVPHGARRTAHGAERRYRAGVTGSPQPLLFLDVDGPLIPFGATREQLPDGYQVFGAGRGPGGAEANPLVTRADPAHGPRLLALPCELVWATTWMSEANAYLTPWLGLPELPVVNWPDPPLVEGQRGLHWKTPGIVGWACGRPFVWVDDEITDIDRHWVEAHHPGPALLHRVDAWRGLTGADFTVLDTWLRCCTA